MDKTPYNNIDTALIEELELCLAELEGERCEFKETKSNYQKEKLVQYCCALANEGGGKFILGVTDKRPRRVVGTQAYQQPEVQDPRFVRFLEKIGQETLASFNTHDFLALDLIHKEEAIPAPLRDRLSRLVNLGVVERVGRGRGTRFILSQRFHAALGERGSYTRRRGLDRETNKALLLKHIKENEATGGAKLSELMQVLPSHSRGQIQILLRQLKDAGKVSCVGATNASRWFPA